MPEHVDEGVSEETTPSTHSLESDRLSSLAGTSTVPTSPSLSCTSSEARCQRRSRSFEKSDSPRRLRPQGTLPSSGDVSGDDSHLEDLHEMDGNSNDSHDAEAQSSLPSTAGPSAANPRQAEAHENSVPASEKRGRDHRRPVRRDGSAHSNSSSSSMDSATERSRSRHQRREVARRARGLGPDVLLATPSSLHQRSGSTRGSQHQSPSDFIRSPSYAAASPHGNSTGANVVSAPLSSHGAVVAANDSVDPTSSLEQLQQQPTPTDVQDLLVVHRAHHAHRRQQRSGETSLSSPARQARRSSNDSSASHGHRLGASPGGDQDDPNRSGAGSGHHGREHGRDGGNDAARGTAPDRISGFFGYNGRDPLVPKPAYDAALHRIASLETALGSAHTSIRRLMSDNEELNLSVVARDAALERQAQELASTKQELEEKSDHVLVAEQRLVAEAEMMARERHAMFTDRQGLQRRIDGLTTDLNAEAEKLDIARDEIARLAQALNVERRARQEREAEHARATTTADHGFASAPALTCSTLSATNASGVTAAPAHRPFVQPPPPGTGTASLLSSASPAGLPGLHAALPAGITTVVASPSTMTASPTPAGETQITESPSDHHDGSSSHLLSQHKRVALSDGATRRAIGSDEVRDPHLGETRTQVGDGKMEGTDELLPRLAGADARLPSLPSPHRARGPYDAVHRIRGDGESGRSRTSLGGHSGVPLGDGNTPPRRDPVRGTARVQGDELSFAAGAAGAVVRARELASHRSLAGEPGRPVGGSLPPAPLLDGRGLSQHQRSQLQRLQRQHGQQPPLRSSTSMR